MGNYFTGHQKDIVCAENAKCKYCANNIHSNDNILENGQYCNICNKCKINNYSHFDSEDDA
jgi:hypothetical protein